MRSANYSFLSAKLSQHGFRADWQICGLRAREHSMRPAHCSFFSTILESQASYSLVMLLLCSHPYADSSVECKNGVYVAQHNKFLSIIKYLKRDRQPAATGAQEHKQATLLSIIIKLKRKNQLGTRKHTIWRACRDMDCQSVASQNVGRRRLPLPAVFYKVKGNLKSSELVVKNE